MDHLAHKIVKRVQINAAHGDAGHMQRQQFAPDFFARVMQADDDDGIDVHAKPLLRHRSVFREGAHAAAPLPFPKDMNCEKVLRQGSRSQTEIVLRSGATRSCGSVSFCTSAGVTPGATSRRMRPAGLTSMTARSDTMT